MEIHHYTSIDNLALILKSKTIRFTRLDKVDDGDEAKQSSNNIKLSHYAFVSCWSDNKEESIPLWKMYAGKDMNGVRITLDSDMFLKYPIESGNYHGINIIGGTSILPIEKAFTKDYYIVPPFFNSTAFLKKIEYVEEPSENMEDVARLTYLGNNKGEMNLDTKKIGIYKRKCWSFQCECRFILIIIPNPNHTISSESSVNLMTDIYNGIPPTLTYYDMKLDPSVLSNMKITLSPTCTDAERIIIESLVKEFVPNASINSSALSGLIKF